ncbi:MAG TPA: glycosyltransferase family 39 protein [Ktedonobacteraceae bacterium]|nr:glycosyltransferase family 39 protein [Ktedonobacteraceae bacterium]
MADTTSTITQVEPEHPKEQRVQQRFPWHRLALLGIVLVSAFMDFYRLGQNGFGSYYPAAVRSMMDSWHNFFFAAYDPGGFVTIDKPPVGFWFEVASAKIFGFNSVSILLPQAIAGVLSVLLLYYLVRRHFGVVAGLLAALALAVTPISVVTSRNTTIDSILCLTLLVGAWAVIHAAETGKLRWLLLSAVIVGIGFNIKMMEAYLVVPAYGLLYLLAAPRSIWKRVGHLALAGLVLLVVSFSWITVVDLTPASQRPYVDSTQDNSELSLAIGYNGIERLLGRFGNGFGGGSPANTSTNATNSSGSTGVNRTPPTNGNGGSTNTGRNVARLQQPPGGGGFGGIFDTGNPSPLRLFNISLGGQVSWLLPIALFGMLALAWQRRPRIQSDRQQQSLVFWGTWLLTMGIFFSVAGFFHQYYMTEMAPAIAALFGIGLVVMWRDYRRGGWRGWLLPLALIATVAEQIHLLNSYPEWSQRLTPILIALCILAVVVLVVARIAPRYHLKAPGTRFILPALGALVLALMLAPTVWAAIPVTQGTQADLLVAGPSQSEGFGGNFTGRGRDTTDNSNTALISYLEANQGTTKFLVAVPSSMTADSIILATNKPVMSLGGFSGSDPILTTSQLAALVKNGTVRFFLLNSFNRGGQIPPQFLDQIPQQFRNFLQGRQGGQGGFGFGGGQQSALTSWVTQNCKVVPTSQWQTSSTNSGSSGFGPGRSSQLYDCAATQ